MMILPPIRLLAVWLAFPLALASPFHLSFADDSFPIVPDDVAVSLFARDPLVRNPCALAFDAQGRLCVGMGPQYRSPKPDTPGDSVWILLDEDRDGMADARLEFATGLNAIQGLAWRGDQLWVANAPDLTVVRDLDGDDVADEYVRLYTDLGNIEHGLHGLNWGPDGKLYMSKGNSKGLNRSPDRMAPKPFRDLWGMSAPPGTPDFPAPVTFTKDSYQKNYHDPSDDWGLSGGILRCNPDGSGLEIVSRGYRNPWDITFDDGFDWLGTDNDQNHGDKIFSPFYGAHFGWGHPWSYEWEGNDHLPTAPSSGPLFEGSGTGVLFLGLARYPEQYRNVFLVNDWLKRQIYIYRPRWHGAWMQADGEVFDLFADAGRGRSMDRSDGRSFDPVDIELGPDGAIYVGSWGRDYGVKMENGKMANEGRIYRLWPKAATPQPWPEERDPWSDLSSHLPIWRINAQEAILAQGRSAMPKLKSILTDSTKSKRLQTWAAWTLGRMAPEDPDIDTFFESQLETSHTLNQRLQALRILAHRAAQQRPSSVLPGAVREALQDGQPRVRHEAVLAIWQAGETRFTDALIELAARENDRIVFYSTWGALRHLLSVPERARLLTDIRNRVRLAAFLALLEEDALDDSEIESFLTDSYAPIASLASKRAGGKDETVIKGPAIGSPREEDAAALEVSPVSVVTAIQSASGRTYREATLARGAKAYTDRHYRFRKIPDELHGETFIQVANNDADATQGTGFRLTLRYPSTVFLADAVRGGMLPRWARGRYQPSELTFHNGDSEMRVYQADFPAGEVVFGPNRDEEEKPKCHYHVIVRPYLIDPPEAPPQMEDVKAALAAADVSRGRTLFLSRHGATCVTCHQMEDRGNVFAPDLSTIGSRADTEFIIRSILEPSAHITEGFAMQVVTTKDGESIGGIVLEETGQALTFGVAGGVTVSVPRADIVKRETAAVSAMPPLGPLLNAQQIADITAYLVHFQRESPSDEPPKESISGKSWGQEETGFRLTGHDDRLDIALNGQDIASYYFAHKQTKRPFFAHVKTPGGHQVTRNFPPIEGQDPTDHAFMHPGLSLGFAVLDGENFWHNDRGIVHHEGFIREPEAGETARFAVRNRYASQDGSTICIEEARYAIYPNEDGYLISLDTEFSSPKPFYFGVREEMGLALRVASPLRVKDGNGAITSASGGKNEEGTWGLVDVWWDYAGTIHGKHVGLQLMSGPGNPPVWAHSRDYGVLVANPFPVDKEENREKQTIVDPKQPLRLRFGIQVHEHGDGEEFVPAQAYTRYQERGADE